MNHADDWYKGVSLVSAHSESAAPGVIYDYVPSRRWPFHVRPDGWPEDVAGIAYTEEELEPITPARVIESSGKILSEQ